MVLKDANIEISERKDFSGGWTRSRYPAANETPDCVNVFAVDGKLRNLPGEVELESGQIRQPGVTTPVHMVVQHPSNFDLITQTDDKIYRLQYVTSGFNLPPSDATGSVTINPATVNPSPTFYNDNLYCTDPSNPIWTLGILGNATVATTDIDSAYCLGVFKDRLVAAGCKIAGVWYPTAVCYSDQDDASSFDIAYNRWELENDSKECCVHCSSFGDAFYIYKTHSIAKISGYPPYDWTVERSYINGIGPVGRDCVKRGYLSVKGQSVEVDFFISYQGLYAFDGTNLITLPFGKEVDYFRSFWKDILWDTTGPHRVSAVFDEDNGLYKVWFTEGSFTNSSMTASVRGICYDAINNVVWPMNAPNIPTSACHAIVPDDVYDLHHHVVYGHSDTTITRETTRSSLCHTGTTLITNGDMELDSDWTTYDPGTTAVITNERTDTFQYNGTYSRHIVIGAAASVGGCSQSFATTVGKTYRVYGRVKTSSASVGNVLIQDGLGTLLTITPHDSSPWQDFVGTFVARYATTTIILRVVTALSEAWFDAVECFELTRQVYYKSEIADMGSSYAKKQIKEMGVEHDVATSAFGDASSFTIAMSYDDGASSSSTITISQAPTATEKSKLSSCTSASAGIVGTSFRRCQATLTLIPTGCAFPSWELSSILISFNPTTTTFLFEG